tara:strand:+ start:151 stop:498 length:348 start_codon:yes stop_codon:yes gene_type:complete
MEKIKSVEFLENAKDVFMNLYSKADSSKKARMLFKAIEYKIEIIKNKPDYGNRIPKRLIPNEYKLKYEVDNLFRVELPCFWRMLYTIKKDEIEIVAFVVDIVDHKKYNKIFGYKS